MKIETTFQDDHQAKIVAEVTAEQFEGSKQRAARKLARKVKIPGFRPGKAPYAVITRQIGEAAVVEEALDLFVDEFYPKIIEEAGIHPYGPGSITNISQLDPPILEFVIPLEPDVNIGDYHSLSKEYKLPQVMQEEIDAWLENLRQRQVVLEDVDRAAQENDLVTVKISANRLNVEADQEPSLIKERSIPIVVQTQPANDESPKYEWPFTGFSKHLIGMSAGESQSFQYEYPEDAEQEGFRGVKAVFNLEVEGIKARLLPQLDDDFAKTVGEFDNLEALVQEIRNMLEEEKRNSYENEYTETLLEEAIDLGDYKYPPQMVERELDNLIQSLENNLQQQNLTMDLYLKSRDMDLEGLREESRPYAEKQVKKQLFLMKLAETEKLEVKQKELLEETNQTINYLASSMPEKEAKRLAQREVYTNVVSNVYANLLNRQSLSRLRDIASGQLSESDETVKEVVDSISNLEDENALVDQLTEELVDSSDIEPTN